MKIVYRLVDVFRCMSLLLSKRLRAFPTLDGATVVEWEENTIGFIDKLSITKRPVRPLKNADHEGRMTLQTPL